MKRYYEICIRPTSGSFSAADLSDEEPLFGWDRLELAEAGARIEGTPVLKDLGDGTMQEEAQKIVFSAGTLRVDSEEYSYLKDIYHNKLCDVMLLDSADLSLGVAVVRIRVHVKKIAESAGDIAIRLLGKAEIPVANLANRYVIFSTEGLGSLGMIEGVIYAANGTTPLADAYATAADVNGNQYFDATDKDGRYMFILPKGAYDIAADKAGATFPSAVSVTVVENQTIIHNIVATA